MDVNRSAQRLFCPPAPRCEAAQPESIEAIELEILLERLLFAALSRSYEIPRGALRIEVMEKTVESELKHHDMQTCKAMDEATIY